MNKKWWLFAAVLLLVFLIIQAPARFVINKVMPANAALRLHNIHGSLWQGRADVVTDSLTLHNVQWTVKPMQLFLGRLQINLAVDDGDLQLTSTAQIAFNGAVTLRDTSGALPAAQLNRFLPMKGLQLSGDMQFDLAEVMVQQQQLQQLSGMVQWREAAVKTPMGATELGAYRVDLIREASGAITGDVQDLGGVLDLQGKLVLVNQTVSFNGSVKRELPDHVARFFRMFARDNGARLEFTFNRALGSG